MEPKDPDYKTIWRNEDDRIVKKMAVRIVHKKREIVKLCLNVIENNCDIVKKMNPKEKMKEKISWNVEDDRNVEMLRIWNIQFLSLKDSKMTGGVKVNVLEKFCERKGVNEVKENWRQDVEHEIELKEN